MKEKVHSLLTRQLSVAFVRAFRFADFRFLWHKAAHFMDIRRFGLVLLVALGAGLIVGCRKSEPDVSTTPDQPAPVQPTETLTETVARLHWLGKKRLAAETNAAHLMSIWNLPESGKLGQQTLDKLSLAPWRLLKGDLATNGAPTTLFRPLLDDLVQEESYLEVRNFTNQPGELVFAIRLNADQVGVWQTNLAIVVESLTGLPVAPTTNGWSLKKQATPNLIEFARIGEWAVLGLAQERNGLLAKTVGSIQQGRLPLAAPATNHWLTLLVDLPRVVQAFSLNWHLPDNLPRVSLSVVGNGSNVQTRGEFTFPKPLDLELEPWNIPTNFIHEPLVSFTAIRGIGPWLSANETWKTLQFGDAPNQLFAWAQEGLPLLTFFGAPVPDASNRVNVVTDTLLLTGNAWLRTNGMGRLARLDAGSGVSWTGLPFISMELSSKVTSGGEFAVGGLLPDMRTNLPPPQELIQTIRGWTNLVSYEWEITEPRLEAWLYIGQVFRLAFHKAQLPTDSAGYAWMKSAAPKLGNCLTVTSKNGSSVIALVRQSSVGFTAVELHLLVDWLESPHFPRGLHTFNSPSNTARKKPLAPGSSRP